MHDVTFLKYFDNPTHSLNLASYYINYTLRKCIKNSSAIIAVSNSTKSELIKEYNIKQKQQLKIKVIYEGWEHLAIKRNENCKEFKMENESFLFYLGSSRKHKNISNLLQAFKYSLANIPSNIKLVVTGNNKYLSKKDVQIYNEINQPKQRVYFTGYLKNECISKFFKNADAYILPSFSEGFGLPILEAFYYQKPVLCSNTTSIPEVAGDAALYFNPFDPNDMAKAIIYFYSNSDLREELQEKGMVQLTNFPGKRLPKKHMKYIKVFY